MCSNITIHEESGNLQPKITLVDGFKFYAEYKDKKGHESQLDQQEKKQLISPLKVVVVSDEGDDDDALPGLFANGPVY